MTEQKNELSEIIEKLAAIEHDRWSDWHKHAAKNWNVAMVSRWNQQADTPYCQLSESEKESDRKEVRRYWKEIQKLLAEKEAVIKGLVEKFGALIQKLDYVHNHHDYFSVWQCAQNHQGKYDGPTYEQELDKAREALALAEGRKE